MKRQLLIFFSIGLLISLLFLPVKDLRASSGEAAEIDRIFVSGEVLDSHKEPVKEAELRVLINGEVHKLVAEHKEVEATETSSHGTYQLEFDLPPGTIDTATIQLELSKTSYKTTLSTYRRTTLHKKTGDSMRSRIPRCSEHSVPPSG